LSGGADAVHVYQDRGDRFEPVAELARPADLPADFVWGRRPSLRGHVMAIGATAPTGSAGRVYVYRGDATARSWEPIGTLHTPPGAATPNFGMTSALTNGSLVVTAQLAVDPAYSSPPGAVYDFSCLPTDSCGDGWLVAGEQCDDGNRVVETCPASTSCQVCGADCRFGHPLCGNGSIQSGEQCDDGNATTERCPGSGPCSNVCGESCQLGPGLYCGDGVVQTPLEQCDDGNALPDDGCEPDCTPSCLASGVSDASCNGQDDDCDGLADEDVAIGSATCGLGVCATSGSVDCSAGLLIADCAPAAPTGVDDDCDGVDDDCDLGTDEGFDGPTSCGVGVCARTGVRQCLDGTPQVSCTPGAPTGADDDCNGLDENCNGVADENYAGSCECGNGVLDPGESCDDGNLIATDGCTNDCELPSCDDGSCVGTSCAEPWWDHISLGGDHTCGLRSGRVYCWGYNNVSGELGRTGNWAEPVQVGTEADWIAVESGGQHNCGIRNGGELYCWGSNAFGSLGAGPGLSTTSRIRVGTDSDWTAVATFLDHTCALRAGRLYCWGRNDAGAIGDGTQVNRDTPVQVGAATDWQSVDVGDYATCGTRAGGQLWCWGDNLQGELGFGHRLSQLAVTQTGTPHVDWSGLSQGASRTFALRNGNAYVSGWPDNSVFVARFGGDWTRIAHGRYHVHGLSAGRLYAWRILGYEPDFGQFGLGSTAATGTPIQVGTASDWTHVGKTNSFEPHICGIRSGSVYCWGAHDAGRVYQAPNVTSPVAIHGPAAPCNPRVESGVVTVGATPVRVTLQRTYYNPVVVASVQYANNTAPVVTRVKHVTANSFVLRLQSPTGATPVADKVHYLVVEEGVWNLGGVKLEAHRAASITTDNSTSWVGQQVSYGQHYDAPVVLGQVMTENDPRWSAFWSSDGDRNNPASGSSLFVGKHVAGLSETRAPETLGYVVFEAGSGTLAGRSFRAGVFSGLQGMNGGVGSATLSPAFASAPTSMVTTMAAMRDPVGGWAYVWGEPGATTSTLSLRAGGNATSPSYSDGRASFVVFEQPATFPVP
jgi:cysteine-rich repeat protein